MNPKLAEAQSLRQLKYLIAKNLCKPKASKLQSEVDDKERTVVPFIINGGSSKGELFPDEDFGLDSDFNEISPQLRLYSREDTQEGQREFNIRVCRRQAERVAPEQDQTKPLETTLEMKKKKRNRLDEILQSHYEDGDATFDDQGN